MEQYPFHPESGGGWRQDDARPLVWLSALCFLRHFGIVGKEMDRAHTTSYSNLVEPVRLSCTVVEILLIFQKLQRSCDSDHAPFGDCLSSVGWDLL